MQFMFLVFMHLLADFVFQNDFQAKNKGTNVYIMFVHCYIWAMTILITIIWLGYYVTPLHFLFLFSTHFVIDTMKCKGLFGSKPMTVGLWIDQGFHILTITITMVLIFI